MTKQEVKNLTAENLFEVSATFASIVVSTQPRFISVLADENSGGSPSLYFFDGSNYFKL